MNVLDAFGGYLEATNVGTLGTSLFIGNAPSSDEIAADVSVVTWLKANGGAPTTRLSTGELVKSYLVQVFFRAQKARDVYDRLFALETQLNGARTVPLEGFTTYQVSADTFPVDQDLDDEDQKVGLLQATLVIYKDPQ